MKVMLTVNTEQIDDVSVVIDMLCRPMNRTNKKHLTL